MANPAVFTSVVTELARCLKTARFVCYPLTMSAIISSVISVIGDIQPILEDEEVDGQYATLWLSFPFPISHKLWRETKTV